MITLESLLSSTGMRSDDQKQFISKMNASRDSEIETKLRKALVDAGVPASFHDKVVDSVDGHGLFPSAHAMRASASDMRLAKIAAAAETPSGAPKLQLALGELRRLGISLETAVDTTQLHNALKGYPPERRMQIKSALAAAKIID